MLEQANKLITIFFLNYESIEHTTRVSMNSLFTFVEIQEIRKDVYEQDWSRHQTSVELGCSMSTRLDLIL
jgi:hypothetical protein